MNSTSASISVGDSLSVNRGHLRGDAAVTDHLDRGWLAQALEIAG